ncbi:MAG: restriction endonuclease subunit S [Bacilli bacterium]|nr:restriction endonuclease subunit S [Bacilli bacterium]
MKLTRIKLGDVLDIKRGTSLSGDKYATSGRLIRLTLGNFDYSGGGFKENTSKENIYYVGSVRNDFIMQKGDIITPLTEQVRGLLGETARIPVSDLYIQSQDIGKVIPNESKLDKDFAFYLISSPIIKYQLDAGSQQTKIRHTSPDKIKECIAWIPSLDNQRKIAKVLDSLNSKILLNKRIIKELESMAKTLYDYWFLQFEFPNEEGKPYKSSGGKMVWNEELKREIPKGWEVKNAYEIADIKTGKEDANHATKNGKYPFFTCANDVLRCDDYKFDGNVILIAGNGDFNVKHYNGKFNAYQRTYVITPHNDKYVGVFHLSCKQTVEKFIKGSNGSIVKFITLRDIQNIKILDCKNDKLLEPFNVFLEKIDLLKKENQELSSLRDFLLPLLMNGQVKFKDK